MRLILDDLSTILEDETHPRLQRRAGALIDAHPNIEIRLFNAWRARALPAAPSRRSTAWSASTTACTTSCMIADNRAAIMGGRNIGNEYFGLSLDFNFRDLDVLGIGPVARQASAVFDRFWNSEWVVPVKALGMRLGREDLRARARAGPPEARGGASRSQRFPLGPPGLDRRAGRSSRRRCIPAPAACTRTRRTAGRAHPPHAARDPRPAGRRAAAKCSITNAYIIPDESLDATDPRADRARACGSAC